MQSKFRSYLRRQLYVIPQPRIILIIALAFVCWIHLYNLKNGLQHKIILKLLIIINEYNFSGADRLHFHHRKEKTLSLHYYTPTNIFDIFDLSLHFAPIKITILLWIFYHWKLSLLNMNESHSFFCSIKQCIYMKVEEKREFSVHSLLIEELPKCNRHILIIIILHPIMEWIIIGNCFTSAVNFCFCRKKRERILNVLNCQRFHLVNWVNWNFSL